MRVRNFRERLLSFRGRRGHHLAYAHRSAANRGLPVGLHLGARVPRALHGTAVHSAPGGPFHGPLATLHSLPLLRPRSVRAVRGLEDACAAAVRGTRLARRAFLHGLRRVPRVRVHGMRFHLRGQVQHLRRTSDARRVFGVGPNAADSGRDERRAGARDVFPIAARARIPGGPASPARP